MKITRLIHSCMLVEDGGINYLIDPGNFSFDSGQLNTDKLPKIDYVLITHWHEDHCSPQFIESLLGSSPDLKIVSDGEVANVLAAQHLQVNTEPPEGVEMVTLKHAKHWREMPQINNTVFTISGKLTHFGDNRELENVNFAETVAFPITAPWGSLADAINKLVEAKPKRVIPIHDAHLSDLGIKSYYEQTKNILADFEIDFLPLKPTESFDI